MTKLIGSSSVPPSVLKRGFWKFLGPYLWKNRWVIVKVILWLIQKLTK